MSLEITRFVLSDGPKRVAPFSHAVRAGDFLFVTGQMPTDPADNTRCVAGGIEAQTQQVIANLKAVLAGCGAAWERTVMARIYLTDFARDYAAMNAIWETSFPEGGLPARTTVGVTGLALGALVEVDLVVAL
ncbi:RidA family protein [Sediminicoccus sp. KRV36]|uniref:RidA family protein n=1 Tax=Sediminicoccus sp. KRV36 TaxID=3133721 RepID=UPI00200D8CB2|nr:RidA family protein [Sediminicoccus rosea]UPY39131.1 RidA family protein [Sediminicoccus rosea]